MMIINGFKDSYMAFYVHLSIIYNADSDFLPQITDLAERHIADLVLNQYLDYDIDNNYILKYLEAVKKRKHYNAGGKGQLFNWGIVGNHVRVIEFVEHLEPFFKDLLQKRLGTYEDNHIMVFEEQENSSNATGYEIFLHPDDRDLLMVKEHKLPFKWGQT